MSSDILHQPKLHKTQNVVLPKQGSKVKVADDEQTFFVIIKQINGKIIIGQIDNFIVGQKYNYGDQILFFADNIL